MVTLLTCLIRFAIWVFDFAIYYTEKYLWHGFFPRNSIMHTESFEIFSPQKTLFLHHLCSLLRALNKKSSAYKPSPRHLLSGDTKGSASAYTIWAYFGNNQRVSSSVFQRSPIIIVVDYWKDNISIFHLIPWDLKSVQPLRNSGSLKRMAH